MYVIEVMQNISKNNKSIALGYFKQRNSAVTVIKDDLLNISKMKHPYVVIKEVNELHSSQSKIIEKFQLNIKTNQYESM